MAYPVKSRMEEETTLCLRRFKWRHRFSSIYCDRAPELEAAARNIGVPCDHSIAGRSQTNALIERCNQDINRGTRVSLVQAGFPPSFWLLACEHYCIMDNTQGPESPWYKKNKEHFQGKRIPFGAKVLFMPTSTSAVGRQNPKMAPSLVPGIIVGYELATGGRWSGGYKCIAMQEMDGVYELPYARAPHPSYGDAKIPAWEMIRFSVTIMRGCFGGCSFCSITEHEGRIIQSRSEGSILREIETIRDRTEGFTGIISDIGGPTANMYRMACKDEETEAVCRRPSCVFPNICKNLNTSHDSLIQLYRKARELPGVKKVMVASGVRYDLAVRSPTYVKELVTHHVGGYLKIAPEHTEEGPLRRMMKPGIGAYDEFKKMFDRAAKQAGKKYFLIPYFIAAHPGTTDEDMLNLAIWLKQNGFRADQVQTFLPSPMAISTAMYRSGINPLRPVRRGRSEPVDTVKNLRQRRLHKAFLRYHDAENWPLLREALKKMSRPDLIGPGKHHLIPNWQPPGTGGNGGEGSRAGRKHGQQRFLTKGIREKLPRRGKRAG